MPLLFIHVRNSAFCSRDDGGEYADPKAALAFGIASAVSIASDEINGGSRSAAIEVSVEHEDGTRLLSSMLAISVSPLMVVEHSAVANTTM